MLPPDMCVINHPAMAGEVDGASPRTLIELKPVLIADDDELTVNADRAACELPNHEPAGGGVDEGYPRSSIDCESEDPEWLSGDEAASPADNSHLQQYLFTPTGLLTTSECFGQAGIATSGGAKSSHATLPIYNHLGEVEKTAHLVRGGRRNMIELTTRTGIKIVMPAKHRVLVMSGGWWVVLTFGEIEPGDCIMVQRSFVGPLGNPSVYSLGAISVMGIIIADGHLGSNRVTVCNDDPVIQNLILEYGPEIFGFNPLTYQKKGSTGTIDYHFNSKKLVNAFYDEVGWQPCKAAGKQLGYLIRSLDIDGIRAFLQGYFDCECTITDVGCIVVSSASWRLLFEIKLVLLAHFGIISVLRYLKVVNYADNDYWSLTLSGEEAASYVDKVGFLSKLRQAHADKWVEKARNPNIDVIPGLGQLITAIHGGSETNREHMALVNDYKGDTPRANVTYPRLELILNASWSQSPALDRLRQVHDARYFYDEIVSFNQIESAPAFDFDMPDTHTYILNGIATRNSADRVACSVASAA